jgi:hypothetical protein
LENAQALIWFRGVKIGLHGLWICKDSECNDW